MRILASPLLFRCRLSVAARSGSGAVAGLWTAQRKVGLVTVVYSVCRIDRRFPTHFLPTRLAFPGRVRNAHSCRMSPIGAAGGHGHIDGLSHEIGPRLMPITVFMANLHKCHKRVHSS